MGSTKDGGLWFEPFPFSSSCTWCDYEIRGMILLCDSKGAM